MIVIKKKILIVIVFLFVIVILITFFDFPEKIERIIYKKQYEYYVEKYSKEYGVDENIIYATIKAESNFENDAKSIKEAIGLMQLMKNTAKDVADKIDLDIDKNNIEKELLNPDININLGTKYLSMLIENYNNIEVALTAYNAGIGTVDNWIKEGIIKPDGSDIENIPYKETNNYVRKILKNYKIYSDLY